MKGLELLKEICGKCCIRPFDENCNNCALKTIEKELKALEILRKSPIAKTQISCVSGNVLVEFLIENKNIDLLKEVLKNE